MATFHLANFGCRASQADGAALKRQLLEAGLEEAGEVGHSDIAVLNTCTVTAVADAEVRQVIRRIHRANPRCRILVTGCYAQRAPEEIVALEGVAWVIGNSHKHRVAEVLKSAALPPAPGSRRCEEIDRTCGSAALICGKASPFRERPSLASSLPIFAPELSERQSLSASQAAKTPQQGQFLHTSSAGHVMVGEIAPQFHFAPAFPDDRTRPTLKVQDGCDARCSFCVIPAVRGPSRSLGPDRVIEQVVQLEREGYQEIVLSGINLGSYGRDLDRRIHFLGLLERILGETSIARVRISSIEPMDVSAELIRLAAGERRLADHFHVPLQSGSDRLLRLMNRRYWTRQYAERILAIREALPQAGIGADVMAGFPGETEQDHAASVEFIERLPFTYLHVFPFSARPGTAAAARPGQVNGSVARKRARELRALSDRKRQGFLASQIGRTLSVLTLDSASGAGRMALSSNYLKVSLPASNLAANMWVEVQVGRVSAGVLHGFPPREQTKSAPRL
jgi:threonylcarbamoyladenosine tRNA methylthiotransferase MtaB